MQLAAHQLAQHLQGALRPLYVVHGDETLLVQETTDAIRAAARKQGFGERTVFTAEGAGFDWSSVLAAGNSLSLFSDKLLLEVRIPSGKPGRDGATALEQLAASARDGAATLVLITLPRLDRRTQGSAWFKALAKTGTTLQVDSVGAAALPRWIAQRLAAQSQHVASGEEGERTLRFFAARVEGNLLAAHQEIQKLALLYPKGELGWDQVEAAVMDVARYDVFKLTEAALAGQAGRVQRMLDGLAAEGVAPVLVHWVLADDIRALQRVKAALAERTPMPLALRRNRIWGTKERLFERVVPQLSTRTAARLVRSAHEVDRVVKGLPTAGWPTDGWQALARLAFQLSLACRPRAA